MKVAIIYNKDMTGVINVFGMQNKEVYNPKTVKMVASALENGGHNVEIIDGNMHVIERLQNFMPKVIEGERLGMVFNMAYGIQGESRYTHIPSMLEMLGIPYVGSNPSGHALALDKVITKIIMQKNGIPTPDFWVFSSEKDDFINVTYPVIVKPKMESVSYGLKIVNNSAELKKAITYIVSEYNQQALVEQFIPGREFAIGILGNNPAETFPVVEINLAGDPWGIQTDEHKLHKPLQKICPADIPVELAQKMQKLCLDAFHALQLRDFSRVDIRLDKDDNIYLLEINSMASLGRTGSYVLGAEKSGYDYDALVNKILDVAVVRYFAGKNLLVEEVNNRMPLNIRIRSFIRGRQGHTLEMIKEITDTNTYVRNLEGVNKAGNFMRRQLSAIGFSHQVYPQVEIGHMLYFSNFDSGDSDILVLGNLDNSTKPNSHKYFRKTDQKFFGSGVWEHKGGLVAMLLALQSLRFTRHLRKAKINILLATDDTLQGKFSQNLIKSKSEQAKFIFSLHGASLTGGIVTSRSGAAVYKCSMNLKNTDSADNVAKAAYAFTKLVTAWSELTDFEKGIIIAPGEMHIESNITEPHAHGEVNLSVRFNDNEAAENIDKKIRSKIPTKFKELVHFQLEGSIRRPAMHSTEHVEQLWLRAKKLATRLDISLTKEHRWSSASLAFADNKRYMIDGLGPVGIKMHNNEEYILRYSVAERASLLAMLIYDIVTKGE